MPSDAHPRLEAIFRRVVAARWAVVAAYALVLTPAIYFALGVHQDNSLERLIVASDPGYRTNRAFAKVFGEGEYVVVVAEAADPFAPDVLARFDKLEHDVAALPGVQPSSALSVYRRAHGGFTASPEAAAQFKSWVLGTDLFRKQALVGDHFLALALVLDVHDARERHERLAAVDRIVDPLVENPAPFQAVRKVGKPYVNAWLDESTQKASLRYFPLFGLLIVILNLALYRSWRSLVAMLVAIGASVALTYGFVGATGGVFTIVSSLVPMTVLITATATLVYVHSRFVERPPDRDVDEHQVFALANKFVACTASVFATAVGFAALAVSDIRPIRELGLWVAAGLFFTWLTVFTLFPALQKLLRTPTARERRLAGSWFERFIEHLPRFSYRRRFALVGGVLVLCGAGAVALFGLGTLVRPMRIETDSLEYIAHGSRLYQDTRHLEKTIAGLSMTELWLASDKPGFTVTDPDVLRGLDAFQKALEAEPGVGSVVGLPTIARTFRYLDGKGDQLPRSDEELDKLSSQLETLAGTEPMLARFVDKNFTQTHLVVVTRTTDYAGFVALDKRLAAKWDETKAKFPSLAPLTLRITGLSALEEKITHDLVPTLVESFVLSAAIIFSAFLVVFRNGAARIMAMIPSLFAILVMFLVMRFVRFPLDVATVLIASTVLGTSENDQIHFFYHFLEKRRDGSTEEALKHTMRIAGRAILFATIINASGFLAFALADVPPMRHFGLMTALALVLSMIADFTALPAALWMVMRDKPDALAAPSESSNHEPGLPLPE